MDWITDRLPTEADADEDGDVIGLLSGGLTWFGMHWGEIEPGQAWLSFEPPFADPAPTSQPRRIVSITRTVYGTTHTIDAVADDGTAWFMVPGETGEDEWTQLPALPDRG